MIIKKVIRIISFLAFVLILLFINYLRDLSLSTVRSIEQNFNIAVATTGKLPTEVISDRIEALLPEDSGAYVKIRRSEEIFEEYKKNQPFAARTPLTENVFNDYILVYPLNLPSKNAIDEIAVKIKNTDGVEEISYDKDALDICLFLKSNVIRYINFALILTISITIILSLVYLYTKWQKSPSTRLFSVSSYLAYLYYLVITGAIALIGVSSLYRHTSIKFNWAWAIALVALGVAFAALIFQDGKE